MNILETAIKSVTVFTDRAQVFRYAQLSCEQGIHQLEIHNLPYDLVENTLQVRTANGAVLKEVKIIDQQIYKKERLDHEEIKKLESKAKELRFSIEVLKDEISVAKKEREFIKDIAEKLTAGDSTAIELSPDKWIQMVNFYREKNTQINEEIRNTKQKIDQLDEQLNQVVEEIREGKNQDYEWKKKVELIIDVSEPIEVAFEVSYLVLGATWEPVYDVRVFTEEKQMVLSYNAKIHQTTKEDWRDITLKLSTTKVSKSGVQPELEPWRIHGYDPTNRSADYSESEDSYYEESNDLVSKKIAVMEPQRLFASNMMGTDELIGGSTPESPSLSTAHTSGVSALFEVNGTQNIPNGGEPQKVTILIENFPVHFRYSAVPKLSTDAYLKAKVKNHTNYPLLKGESNVFLDNNFVSKSRIILTHPSEEFWTFLGIDESIKIEHKLLKEYNSEEGMFQKKKRVMFEYEMTVKNTKKDTHEIVIWDQLPISDNEKITVEMIEPVYNGDTNSLKMNEHKMLEWFFKLKPQEEVKIPFKFAADCPKDWEVMGLDAHDYL